MNIKKGDVVAVLSRVLAAENGKIEISPAGLEVDTSGEKPVVLVSQKHVKILESFPELGDRVIMSDRKKGTISQFLNEKIAVVLLDGFDDQDPKAYVTCTYTDLRKEDQSNVYKFVNKEVEKAGSETGLEILSKENQEIPAKAESAILLIGAHQNDVAAEVEVDVAPEVIRTSSYDSMAEEVMALENSSVRRVEEEITIEMPERSIERETEDFREQNVFENHTEEDEAEVQDEDNEGLRSDLDEDESAIAEELAAEEDEESFDEIQATADEDQEVSEPEEFHAETNEADNQEAMPPEGENASAEIQPSEDMAFEHQEETPSEDLIHDPEKEARLASMRQGILENLREEEIEDNRVADNENADADQKMEFEVDEEAIASSTNKSTNEEQAADSEKEDIYERIKKLGLANIKL